MPQILDFLPRDGETVLADHLDWPRRRLAETVDIELLEASYEEARPERFPRVKHTLLVEGEIQLAVPPRATSVSFTKLAGDSWSLSLRTAEQPARSLAVALRGSVALPALVQLSPLVPEALRTDETWLEGRTLLVSSAAPVAIRIHWR